MKIYQFDFVIALSSRFLFLFAGRWEFVGVDRERGGVGKKGVRKVKVTDLTRGLEKTGRGELLDFVRKGREKIDYYYCCYY